MLGQGDVGQQPPPASLLRQFGLLAAALAVAVVVPAVYVDHQVDNRIVKQLNEELLHRQFVVRAMNLLDELCELGITEPSIHPLRLLKSESTEKVVFGRKDRVAPRYARDLLKQVEAHFREQVALREQRKPTKKDRLELAFLYFWLDQMQPAIDVLGELPRQDPRAARLLANIYQQQRQHDDSIAAFRRMIELLNVETGESDTRAKAEAYAGVANGYQALRQFDDAEAVYLEALVEVPGEAAFLRFHLGLHYQWVGRPLEARRQLETAADLDPDRFRGQVAAIFRNEMTELSPGCMLGPLR